MSQTQLLQKNQQLRLENTHLKANIRTLQLEIQQRCQNYMMEISHLRTMTKKANLTNRSLQSSRVSSLKFISSTNNAEAQTEPYLNGYEKHQHENDSPHKKLPQNELTYTEAEDISSQPKDQTSTQSNLQRQSQLEEHIKSLRRQFQQNLEQNSLAYKEEITQKNQLLATLGDQIREIKNELEQKNSEISQLRDKIKGKEKQIDRLTSQYQITVNEFKNFQPTIQKSRLDSDSSDKLNKIINCLRKGLSMKLNSKSSKEEEILNKKSYSSEKILFKLKRKMQYVIVVHEIYRGMVKYILDAATGEKMPQEPRIKQQFEEVYSELYEQIQRIQQNLFTTEILKQSLLGQKQVLENKLRKSENFYKKLSMSDDGDIHTLVKRNSRDSGTSRETPSSSKISETPKSFKTPERQEAMERSQVRSLQSSSSGKLRVGLIQGHYMMIDSNKNNGCDTCKQNKELNIDNLKMLIETKDRQIEELKTKYEKLLNERIMVTSGVHREVRVVEEIDLPVPKQESGYVKRLIVRTASKPKISGEVILSLSRSRQKVYQNLVNTKEDITSAIESLRRERTEKSIEKVGKLQKINNRIDKLATKYSPCKRITERFSQLQDEESVQKRPSFKGEESRVNRFSASKR